MNTFKLTTTKNKAHKPVGPNKVYLHLSAAADAADALGGALRAAFEIPMLTGRQRLDASGGCEYWFELDDEQGALFSQVLTMLYFSPALN